MSKYSIANNIPLQVIQECYEKFGLAFIINNGQCTDILFEGRNDNV